MSADPYVCGRPRNKQGRAPSGWLKVSPAAQEPRWFCSRTCAVNWLVADDGVELDPARAARILAEMAGRPWHGMRDMTERRLGRLLGRAFNGLAEAVAAQAARDAAGVRLTVEDLAEELRDKLEQSEPAERAVG